MTEDLPLYALRLGDVLTAHDWVEMRLHRLLGSRWRAVMTEDSPEAGVFGFLLWMESFRQDPAGTLPEDDVELAALAGIGGQHARWAGLRGAGPGEGALYGWRPCIVEDPGGGPPVRRLAHRTIAEIAERGFERQAARRGASAEGTERRRLNRVKARLRNTALRRASADSDRVAARVLAWLDERRLQITQANVQAAIEAISEENVYEFDMTGK